MDASTVASVCIDALGRPIARRRMRTLEEKQRILAEASAPGASVAEVARRHGVNANLVFGWRRQALQGVLGQHVRKDGVKLLPVQVSAQAGDGQAGSGGALLATMASEGRIEITLAKDIRIAIDGSVALTRIEQVLSMLRRLP